MFDKETMDYMMKMMKVAFDTVSEVAEEIDLTAGEEMSIEDADKLLKRMVEVGCEKLKDMGLNPDETIEDHLERNK